MILTNKFPRTASPWDLGCEEIVKLGIIPAVLASATGWIIVPFTKTGKTLRMCLHGQ